MSSFGAIDKARCHAAHEIVEPRLERRAPCPNYHHASSVLEQVTRTLIIIGIAFA